MSCLFATTSGDAAEPRRVGVLTFTKTLNYGALLQAYALQRAICSLGYDAVLLDYDCACVSAKEAPRLPGLRSVAHPKSAVRALLSYPERRRRAEAFGAFEGRNCKSTPRSGELAGIIGGCDTVVVGSDQVWNPYCSGFDYAFFLGDESCAHVRKVSYAASFGGRSVPEDNRAEVGEALRGFQAISVREGAGVAEVSSLSGRDAVVVIDPTLLVDPGSWHRLCHDVPGRYVFAYEVARVEGLLETARAEARRRGIPLVVVRCYGSGGRCGKGVRYENDASPERFLSLVRGAEAVFTSSFHGLCFSIAFNKQVWYGLDGGVDPVKSRMASLAVTLGLEGRALSDFNTDAMIDYTQVNGRLERERARSARYLEEALR